MPIYEYICKACEHRFEKLVKSMSSAENPPCPQCGAKQTARALSAFAVTSQSKSADSSPMCGRCGGPGPCALPD
jgi:putative FmdB family regulatory protein